MGMGRMNPGKKGVRTILESDLWRIAESRSTAAIRSVRGGGGGALTNGTGSQDWGEINVQAVLSRGQWKMSLEIQVIEQFSSSRYLQDMIR